MNDKMIEQLTWLANNYSKTEQIQPILRKLSIQFTEVIDFDNKQPISSKPIVLSNESMLKMINEIQSVLIENQQILIEKQNEIETLQNFKTCIQKQRTYKITVSIKNFVNRIYKTWNKLTNRF